jgi:hypothetical protein
MRRVILSAVLVGTSVSTLDAQTLQVGETVTVARETEPRRFSEPHLAIHPGNAGHFLAAVWTAATWQDENQARRCISFVSVNGGATWSRHDFALANCYDAQVAILPDGQAVFVALATLPGLRPDRSDWLVVFHSNDGGVTWDEAPTTLGWRYDHPAIAVDRMSPKRKGWIYLTSHLEWSDGTPQRKSAVFVARSRDGGKTFDVPVLPSPSSLHNFAEMPVVLSDGTLVASFVDQTWTSPYSERRRAWIIRSVDGGATFSAPQLVNEECGPPPGFQLSALAVDASDGSLRDRLYFACRQNAGGPVLVVTSSDGGETWNRPGVVVGSSRVDKDARRVMTLAVNNKGVVGVMVIERRAQTGDGCLAVEFSVSLDGANTFLPPQQVASSACGNSPNDQIAQRRFPTYGDYFGLTPTPDARFRLMWPEMRAGASVLLTTTVAVDVRMR